MNFNLIKQATRFSIRNWVVFLLASVQSLSFSAGATEQVHNNSFCQDIQQWSAFTLNPPSSKNATMAEIGAQQLLASDMLAEVVGKVFKIYSSGNLRSGELKSCLNTIPNNRGDFTSALGATFLNRSIKRLQNSRSPLISKFMKAVELEAGDVESLLFSISGHFIPDYEAGPLKAGFHRGSGSLFADIDAIDPNEWLLIIVHELSHRIDHQLRDAIISYNNDALVKSLAELAHQVSDPTQLSSEQQMQLDGWLRSGLDRGLWAEYRAWVLSFILYREGLKENLWGKIPWIENVLSRQQAKENLSHLVYRYLDPRFQNPQAGMFSLPLIQTELHFIRDHVLRSEKLPSLGNFNEILK